MTWQSLEVVKLLQVAVADIPSRLVSFPNQSRVSSYRVALLGVNEGGVPAPTVGSGNPYAAL
jgi:hypothetical protein